ncbi:MAG: nucleotidyltransferase family protein [Planctomycetes bacterium]|nr:nucleotidyltransferase family protein [Planctomycetota bacterium]MBU1517744.1 nucleotidyltransferase family protein [Planctomycetota bacterium]MBU2457840.1 nucleotidyltransferase family protein [Planctomycetota bacterium]MBU2596549.1 nucleotidyltransferase family protein [Planctomycetota bacterium]
MNNTRRNKSGRVQDDFGTKPIMRKLQSHRRQIKKLGVKQLGLFGSAARGDMRANSDVDIVVKFDKTTYRRYLSLKILLEDILGRDVDLLTMPSVQGRLKKQIKKDYINVSTY